MYKRQLYSSALIENYNENYYVQCCQQLRRTADEKFKIEDESYLPFILCEEKQSTYSQSQNPLLFWRDHGNNLSTLQVLAGLSLGMSAGLIAVESVLILNLRF